MEKKDVSPVRNQCDRWRDELKEQGDDCIHPKLFVLLGMLTGQTGQAMVLSSQDGNRTGRKVRHWYVWLKLRGASLFRARRQQGTYLVVLSQREALTFLAASALIAVPTPGRVYQDLLLLQERIPGVLCVTLRKNKK